MSDLQARLHALPAFPSLQGRRVLLRGPRDGDAAAVFGLFNDPRVMRYWSSVPMVDQAQAHGRIEDIAAAFAQRTMINWLIADADDLVVGSCTLHAFDGRHRRAAIGYALRADLWGRGLAREATTLAIGWAFRTLALHRIEAEIDPRNDASRGLLQRLGFRSEGVMRQRYFVGETVTDEEIFGLLRADWEASESARRS